MPGRREPGNEPLGVVEEREYSLSLSNSNGTVYVSFLLPTCFTVESADSMRHGSRWFDVRAGTLVFVTTGARY